MTSSVYIILIISVLLGFCTESGASYWEDDEWLKTCLISGRLDTLRDIKDKLPELTASGQFFRGLFETDGEKARYYYDRTVALYGGSVFECFALERLWQYHWAKGDAQMAERYWNFLKQRHPDFPGLKNPPAFTGDDDLSVLSRETLQRFDKPFRSHPAVKGNYWTVQLGAFRNPDGARRVGQEASRFGKVTYVKKEFKSQTLTVVQAGKFKERRDAEALEKRIRSSSDLRGRVIEVIN